MKKYKVIISKFCSQIVYADRIDRYFDEDEIVLVRDAVDRCNDCGVREEIAAVFNKHHIIGIYDMSVNKTELKCVEEQRRV